MSQTPAQKAAQRAARRTAQRAKAAPASPATAHFSRPVLAGGLAVVLALAAGGAVLASSGDDGTPEAVPTPSVTSAASALPTASASPEPAIINSTRAPDPALDWRDAALMDLRPLTGQVVNLGKGFESWRKGEVPDADERTAMDQTLVAFREARDAIAVRKPFATAPRALADLQMTAHLYVAAVRVVRAATEVTDPALKTQLQQQFLRLRNLADRFFDQADAELSEIGSTRPPIEGVTVIKGPEVPEWSGIGLAAGPPLDDPQPSRSPRLRQEDRAQEAFAQWRSHVVEAGVPTASEESAALRAGDADGLRDLARRFVAASDALNARPDPTAGRLTSTRVQLGLLVHAEAARAAQAAALTTGSPRSTLVAVGQALARAGDTTWDSRLGPRATGFPATALSKA